MRTWVRAGHRPGSAACRVVHVVHVLHVFHALSSDSCTDRSANKVDAQALAGLLPLAAAFVVVDVLAVRLVFPRLSSSSSSSSSRSRSSSAHDKHDGDGGEGDHDYLLPMHASSALRPGHAEQGKRRWWTRRGGGAALWTAAWAFGTTVSLAVVLGLLILGEILEVVDPVAKRVALRVTVPALLFLLVVLVPWLQCRAVVASAAWAVRRRGSGSRSRSGSRSGCRMGWALQLGL
ncbi:hypothetical protein E4U41_001459, partial [Claviceps citrina]